MLKYCNYRSIISKIIIAQYKNKRLVHIGYKKIYKSVLNLLWIEGYIYGYYIQKKNIAYKLYTILIKYPINKLHIFDKTSYIKKLVSYNRFRSINTLEYSYCYLLINDRGLFTYKTISNFGVGGLIFVKI